MPRSLGDFEQLLLFAVLRLKDDAYGLSIQREIEKRTGREVSVGAVYTGLDRLARKGFISSKIGEATQVRGGRRKKLYHLEPEGAAALQGTWDSVTGMAEGLLPQLRAVIENPTGPKRA